MLSDWATRSLVESGLKHIAVTAYARVACRKCAGRWCKWVSVSAWGRDLTRIVAHPRQAVVYVFAGRRAQPCCEGLPHGVPYLQASSRTCRASRRSRRRARQLPHTRRRGAGCWETTQWPAPSPACRPREAPGGSGGASSCWPMGGSGRRLGRTKGPFDGREERRVRSANGGDGRCRLHRVRRPDDTRGGCCRVRGAPECEEYEQQPRGEVEEGCAGACRVQQTGYDDCSVDMRPKNTPSH
jgi:hypothetical protein